MNKICGYNCEHNKSGVCQISGCDKKSIILDYIIAPNSNIKPLLDKLEQENKILKENAEHNDKVVDKVNWENMLLKKENEQLKERIEYLERSNNRREDIIIEQRQEINNLEDNWDELKEYLHNVDVVVDYSENYDGHFINYDELIDKMQELEQGSDNNE